MSSVFHLNRVVDTTGISGTGIVADGIIFPNGKVALCWRGPLSSVVVHDNVKNVQKLHCHGDNTILVYERGVACDI